MGTGSVRNAMKVRAVPQDGQIRGKTSWILEEVLDGGSVVLLRGGAAPGQRGPGRSSDQALEPGPVGGRYRDFAYMYWLSLAA